MARLKASELRNLSAEELTSKENDLRQELFNLRFQNATGQLENPVRISTAKKELAKVLTVKNELRGNK